MATDNSSTAGASPFDSEPTTVPAIQVRIDALSTAMVAKALRTPEVTFMLTSLSRLNVLLRWNKGSGDRYDYGYEHCDSLAEADAWVAALPTPEQARMTAFLTHLDETIQLGKKADVEIEAINPLLEIFKRISKNAITHQVAP